MKPFDESGAFLVNPQVSGDLRRLATKGAGSTILSACFGLLIQMTATMILARLLTPEEFGIVAMVTTFSALLMNCGGNGFNEVVIQREEINHNLVSNLFWINFGIGACLTVLFALTGSLIARVYGNPHVKEVAIGMSLTILMSSLSVLHLALLRRAMRFSVVSTIDLVGRACSVVVSILLGLAGWGHWALVAGAVTAPTVSALCAWSECRWFPGLPKRVPGTGLAVRFAANTFGRFTLNYISRNGDNLLVGWRFNAHSLGLYKRAYDLFAISAGLFITPITLVMVSALSRLKSNASKYRQYLLDSLELVAAVGMGLGVALTLVGKDLTLILLGPGWERTGEIFRWFGLGVGVMMLYYTHSWIHLSIGRPDRWLRWGVVELAVTGPMLILGLTGGPEGVAVAWSLSFWILTIPALWYAGRPIGIRVGPIIAIVWRYVAASLLASGGVATTINAIPSLAGAQGPYWAMLRLVLSAAWLVVLYTAAVALLHWSTKPIRRIGSLIGQMLPGSRFSESGAAPIPLVPIHKSNSPDSFTLQTNASLCGSKQMVSILIPAYNAEEWISDTLRSAIAQTWEPKEIIVVDDGSTDETLTIARTFETAGVRVFAQNNQGAAAARNRAFSFSKGAYLQWLDADDLLAPDKIAKQMIMVEQCQNKRILLSSAFGRFMHRYYNAKFIPTALWKDLSPVDWVICKMEQNVYMQTATWLVSRELTEAAGPWNTQLLSDDDGEYFCRVILAAEEVRFVPDAKVYYRTPWFTSLGYIGQSDRKLKAHWLSMQLHLKHLLAAEDSPRVRAALREYLRLNLLYFYPDEIELTELVRQKAKEFGFELPPPTLSWKYAVVRNIFGWKVAKRFQQWFPRIRWAVQRHWDKMLFHLEDRIDPWIS